jgi:predicted ABC-type transport system involved in lysophospholipase L1 biosynthesis ATPase subunit
LHVLGGLIEPSSGTVEWHGRPMSATGGAARRARRLSYVFQGANLLPHFTAFENVAFAAQLGPGDADGALTAPSLLGLVGLGAKLDHLPADLSGGEAQRVAIARALSQQPELLLCDEPTGHLDTDTGERVLDLIDALQDKLGFAIVVATHDPAVAARFQREVELDDGIVVREGTAS